MRHVRLNDIVPFQFTPVDPADEYTKKAGLVDADFSKAIWRNAVAPPLDAYEFGLIQEIAGSPGEYRGLITFKAMSGLDFDVWELEIVWGAEKERFVEVFRVSRFVIEDTIRGIPL